MFGKKTTADELLKLYSALSDEEKEKFLGAVNGGDDAAPATDSEPKAEDEAHAEGTEEPAEEPAAPTEEGTEETSTEETSTEDNPVEDAPSEEAPTEEVPATPDAQTQDNFAEVLEGFGSRLSAIEEAIKGFTELKELMEKFTQAQADKFGYNGTVPGGKKDYQEMSAEELKNEILTGGN